MSLSQPTHRRAFALALAATIALAACTQTTTSPTSTKETPMSASMTVTISQDDADRLALTAPDGWTVAENSLSGPNHYLATSNADGSGAAIRVNRTSPKDLAFVYNYPDSVPFDVDVDAHYREGFSSTEQDPQVSELTELPARSFGDARALGYSYLWIKSDDPHYEEAWVLARRDGLWEVTARSATGETSLPAEAATALDSIRWSADSGS